MAPTPVLAQQQTFAFDIPAQPLDNALRAFARASRQQILFDGALVRAKRNVALKGSYSVEQGLAALLQGKGLRATRGARGAYVISATTNVASQVPPSAGEAVAGSAAADSESASDIIVTAQKREQRTFDVPISIVAMGADQLKKREITSIDDLALAVPGLAIQRGDVQRRIFLRGVGNSSGNSSLVGLYLDEASVTARPTEQLDLRVYDLERVEVLRGPQGTLYGEGSVGGTIRFITKNPALDRFAMEANVAALFTEDGAPSQRIESVVNVPLIDDKLGLRVAGTFDHEGGWIDQPTASRKNFNDQNLVDVRIKGLWQPAPQFKASVMAVIHRNDAPSNIGEDANGDYTQVFNLTTTPSVKDDYDLYNLTLSYDFDAVRVLSTTSLLKQNRELINLAQRVLIGPPGVVPRLEIYTPLVGTRSNILTQELRFTSNGAGPWQWTVGGYYRRAKFNNDATTTFIGFPGPPGSPLPTPFQPGPASNKSKSWAVFGDTSYELTDRLTLGAGLRYFRDVQEATSTTFQTGRFHTLNPRVYAQYKLTRDINVYASAAKGFRSGGFNAFNQPFYDPEAVWTYELGAKTNLAGHRLTAEVAIFYSDYTNYQISGLLPPPAPPFSITSNAGNARIKGIEGALTWRPSDHWTFGFNGNYVDAKFVAINAITASNAVGDRLDLIPEYGFTASVQHDFSWSGRPGFARVDYNQQGSSTIKNLNFGPLFNNKSDTIHALNFHMGLQWNDSLSLGVFGQNLLNDRGYTDPFSITGTAVRFRPRTYGIEFGVKF